VKQASFNQGRCTSGKVEAQQFRPNAIAQTAQVVISVNF
jgi:hypothetical protein